MALVIFSIFIVVELLLFRWSCLSGVKEAVSRIDVMTQQNAALVEQASTAACERTHTRTRA